MIKTANVVILRSQYNGLDFLHIDIVSTFF